MAKKKVKNKVPSKRYEKYKIEGKTIKRALSCPKCGPGIFLAEHKDRQTCGKCSYTVFKDKEKLVEKPKEVPKEEKKQ